MTARGDGSVHPDSEASNSNPQVVIDDSVKMTAAEKSENGNDVELTKGVKFATPTTAKKRKSTKKAKVIELKPLWFLSNWFYVWIWPLISQVRNIEVKKIRLALDGDERARRNAELIQEKWEVEKTTQKEKPSLLKALWLSYGTLYAFIGIWKIIWSAFTWLGAYYFLKVSLEWISEADPSAGTGHAYAVALLLCGVFSSLAIHQLYGQCARVGIQVRAALCSMIYRKALVLARVKGGAGEVLNLMSADVSRIVEALTNFHFLWSAFVEALLILILLIVEIKESAVPAILAVLLLLPVQWYLGSITSKLQQENTAVTTERVHLMSELLTAVKLIKFYAWEVPFNNKIAEIRKREMRLAYKSMFVKSINFAVVFAVPVVVAVLCLVMYVKIKDINAPSATLTFTVLSLLNTLRYPFLMLPLAVKSTAGAKISLQRVQDFLCANELKPLPKIPPPEENKDLAFNIDKSTFTWEGDEQPTLHDISLSLKRGEILAVIGDVGSGKSSLVAALLGQIKKSNPEGSISIYTTTSYVPQEAWLINCSLRDNILFGSPFEQAKYDEVVHVCALERDLTLLVAGDQTEIGERGSNLSGGQKQRVSLARAVYADAETILLDDPLSAVDQNVGRHIFDKCIKKHLKQKGNKAVVLVTHQLHYLEECDHVAVVKNGRITKFGTFKGLYNDDQEFKEMIDNHVSSNSDELQDADDPTGALSDSDEPSEEEQTENEQPKAVSEPGSPVIDVTASSSKGRSWRPNSHLPSSSTVRSYRDFIEMNHMGDNLNVHDRHQLTVRSVRFLEKLNNEDSIRSLNERHNLDFLQDQGRSHDIAKIIERNQITVHSFVEEDKQELAAAIAAAHGRDSQSATETEEDNAPKPPKLIQEDTSHERIGFVNYKQYFKAGSGSTITWLICIFFFVVHGVRIGSDYWLRMWVPDTLNREDDAADFYLGIYGAFVAVFTLGVLLRGIFFSVDVNKKAIMLHNNMFARILRAPQGFFDTTPLARLLSQFSKNQFMVDDTMPDAFMQMLQYAPLALGAMALIAAIVPWNWGPVIGTLFLCFVLVWWSGPAEKKLKQLEAITRPPVAGHLTSTLEGLFSIRAYNAQKRFDEMNLEKLDTNHEALYSMMITKTWVAFNVDLLTSILIYLTALFVVLFRDDLADSSASPELQQTQRASEAGLALSNALQMLVFVQWSIRMMGDVNAQISSVGQITYYGSKAVPQEAPAEIPENRPPKTWPSEGRIEFKDIVLRYQKFGVAVLKKVSFTISPNEKVGIVGRTGSGKSTLLVSLLRIVEAAEGTITIDGIDVSKIGLNDLRNSVAIIPQEPILFKGTIRSNLDPFNRVSDEEIWKALGAVHLADKIQALPMKLEAPVIENGKNYSMGQRQLFCIARAILSKAKILVLDEASSALDLSTDLLIQETIKTVFSDLTVLTIAHRLNTIIEADKVLVMEGGVLQEFDEPIKLLDNPESQFYALVSHTGPAAAAKLKETALLASQERQKNRK